MRGLSFVLAADGVSKNGRCSSSCLGLLLLVSAIIVAPCELPTNDNAAPAKANFIIFFSSWCQLLFNRFKRRLIAFIDSSQFKVQTGKWDLPHSTVAPFEVLL